MKSKIITLTLVTLALIVFIGLGTASFASAQSTYFESTDVYGINTIDEFPVGGNIYVRAHLTANTYFTIYLIPDRDWANGDLLVNSVVTPITLKTDANGYFPTPLPTLIWAGATYGEYDIIADRGNSEETGDGLFTLGTRIPPVPGDPSDNGDISIGAEVNSAGLIVTPEYMWGGLAALGVCFGAFVLVKRKSMPKINPLLK